MSSCSPGRTCCCQCLVAQQIETKMNLLLCMSWSHDTCSVPKHVHTHLAVFDAVVIWSNKKEHEMKCQKTNTEKQNIHTKKTNNIYKKTHKQNQQQQK